MVKITNQKLNLLWRFQPSTARWWKYVYNENNCYKPEDLNKNKQTNKAKYKERYVWADPRADLDCCTAMAADHEANV